MIFLIHNLKGGYEMSFASETKKELTQIEANDSCLKAEIISTHSNEWSCII